MDMAHQIEAIVRNSAISGGDPFKKVKTMITTMLSHLVKQMDAEASRKVYCDKETSDTTKSKSVKEASVDKLSTKVDTQSSESMNLREQVSVLQKELLAIMKTQKEMDNMRKNEHQLYHTTKPQLQMGQEGIKKALLVLRQYYSQDEEKGGAVLLATSFGDHDTQGGAGSSIIGILEVVESDFAKGIANLDEVEQASQAQYTKQTQENQVTKAIKTEDVTFLTKEAKSLSKATSESSTDLDGVQSELDAVNEYSLKIQEECVAKAEPYEQRRKRQETTLKGLQDAKQSLGGGEAFTQQNARHLRGISPHKEAIDPSQSEFPQDDDVEEAPTK